MKQIHVLDREQKKEINVIVFTTRIRKNQKQNFYGLVSGFKIAIKIIKDNVDNRRCIIKLTKKLKDLYILIICMLQLIQQIKNDFGKDIV